MPTATSTQTPILIVGGGPSGLLEAYLLAKLGVPSLVVERHPTRLGAPKAHALSPRSLEICRQFGLSVSAIRSLGSPRDEARHVRFVASLSGMQVGTLPYERMDLDVLEHTPEMIHNIPQPEFEALLSKELKGNPLVEVRLGVTWVSCTQDGNVVVSTVEDSVSNTTYEIESKYVVACDGANSRVRKFLGVNMTGEDAYETLLTIHFNANLKKVVGERTGMLHWIMDPEARGFIIAYNLDGNQVLIHNFDAKVKKVSDFTDEECHRIVTKAIGQDTPFDVIGKAGWILSRRVADQYRVGNVFLSGDSAHAFPPTGGLGLNSGIADAHCLASKLAAVYHGWAREIVLDTYEQERRPVAIVNSEQSVKNGVKIFQLLRELKTEATDPAEARIEMLEHLKDPNVKGHIDSLIEDQREHFDNLMLHIGYVYGDKEKPSHASHFKPNYGPGARLPHCWIRPLVPLDPLDRSTPLPPVDLSYLRDAPAGYTDTRKYSTLDLLSSAGLTLLSGAEGSEMAAKLEGELQKLKVPTTRKTMGVDFELVGEHAREWSDGLQFSKGCVAVVRPDQHILVVGGSDTSDAEAVLTQIRKHYGL
ncbi:3-propionate hydroxylase [Meredithblackwellia eburnea MCA 4105]